MNTRQKATIGAAIAGSMLVGGVLGGAIISSASAATPSPTSTSARTDGPRPGHRGGDHDVREDGRNGHHDSTGGHVGKNGSVETLLTGDTAAKVTAAVKARYPDAVIQRVENDAEGAAYEAHITQADGTRATVKLDSSFTITATETGH